MIQKEFKEPVFEFVKRITDFDNVKYIFLFGSVARETADKRSDIDICVIINDNNRKRISETALDLEKAYNKNIQVVISKNFEGLDDYFIKQLMNEGILLYGKTPIIKLKNLKCEEYVLFSYSLENLKHSEKMKLKRILYGYNTIKRSDKKTYKSFYQGLIKEMGGFSPGKGCLLIPINNSKYIENIFKENKIKYSKVEVLKPLNIAV